MNMIRFVDFERKEENCRPWKYLNWKLSAYWLEGIDEGGLDVMNINAMQIGW